MSLLDKSGQDKSLDKDSEQSTKRQNPSAPEDRLSASEATAISEPSNSKLQKDEILIGPELEQILRHEPESGNQEVLLKALSVRRQVRDAISARLSHDEQAALLSLMYDGLADHHEGDLLDPTPSVKSDRDAVAFVQDIVDRAESPQARIMRDDPVLQRAVRNLRRPKSTYSEED